MKRCAILLVVCAATALLTACGLSDPYATRDDDAPQTTSRVVDNEVRPAAPYRDEHQPPPRPETTPEQAAAVFAELYVNWTYATLPATRRQLAALATGAAAAAQRRAAVETRDDYELRAGKVENHGSVVSVSAERGASADHFVVVTRETTTGAGTYAGLPPAYHVTLATIEAVDGGYAVSSWRPQS